MKKNLILVVFSVIFAFLLALLIDRSVGFFLNPEADIVFKRYSTFKFSSPEFQSEAAINNLGFRGPNSLIKKKKQYRIVAIGDSFTYGWGVNNEETWPEVLAKNLNHRNIDVEIVNLGQPGGSPDTYAKIAEKAIPMLKPDLVLIAMIQGDDLAQTIKNLAHSHSHSETVTQPRVQQGSNIEFARGMVHKLLMPLFPNFMTLRSRASVGVSAEIEKSGAIWKASMPSFLATLSDEQKKKMELMDDEIKGMFLRGELNPGLLAIGLRNSQYFQETLELTNLKVQNAIQRITDQLIRIKQNADKINCKVVVISTPTGPFISAVNNQNYARMGLETDPSFLQIKAMDESLRTAASAANVSFFEVTKRFREKASEQALFFEYDGHYNVAGQKLFAESIEEIIIQQLASN
jgi:lysophospholipase L1-like esterase